MERVPVEGPAADVGAALARRRFMIVSAESCTGGGIGAALTAIAGSLASFDRGLEPWPNCGGALKIIAAIVDPVLMIRLVAHRGVPTRAPPRLTARRLDSRPSSLILTETSSTPAPMLTLGLCSHDRLKCPEIGPLRLINGSTHPAEGRVFTRHTCNE